jgi:FixJ family two-component response regulator
MSPDASEPRVFIVEDDPFLRIALEGLLRSADFAVTTFASATAFLGSGLATAPGCLMLDVGLPGISGLELQEQLARAGSQMPILLMTGYNDLATKASRITENVTEVLEKPFRDQDVLDAVARAMRKGGFNMHRSGG